MQNRYLLYAIIGINVMTAIAAIMTLNIYLIAFTSSLSAILFFAYGLWELVESLFIKRTRMVQMLGDFELEGERDAAVRKKGDLFTATSGAILKNAPTKEINKSEIERVVSNSNSPFRLVVQAERLQTERIVDSLKTKRRIKEIELSKARVSEKNDAAAKHKTIEREIELIENEIKEISTGAIPIKTSIYILTTATADTKFAAQERAVSQAKQVSGEFSAVLGAVFSPIKGSELIKLLSIDSVSG